MKKIWIFSVIVFLGICGAHALETNPDLCADADCRTTEDCGPGYTISCSTTICCGYTCKCIADSDNGGDDGGGDGGFVDDDNSSISCGPYRIRGTCGAIADWTTIGTCQYKCSSVGESAEYRCAPGYYGDAMEWCTGNPNMATYRCSRDCTECPPNDQGGVTSDPGTRTERGCYIPAGCGFSDEIGDGEYDADCSYNRL